MNNKILDAKKRLEGVIVKTPLIYSEILSKEYNNFVYLKPENLQKTGSFKIRGAYNKIATLTNEEKQKGVIASSAGNHAQGVALAAKEANVKAIIVMPKATPFIKISATKSYGAEVILYGDCYDDAYEEAKRIQKEKDLTFIHPFNDELVIAGQGTIGLEIYEELKDVEYVFVPVGGGGLISGIAIALKEMNPNIKVIGVEPEGAKAMKTCLSEDKLVRLKCVSTIADGVAVKIVGDKTFGFVKQYVDDIITVSDYDILEAFLMLLERHKLVVESAGALSLAALRHFDQKNKKVVSLLSGGNIDVVTVSGMINKGLITRGRILCFSLELADQPGQLAIISKTLADLNANVIELDHDQFMNLDRLMHVQLQVTVETNGHEHIKEIINKLQSMGYNVNKIY